jgi:hypothetical protein
MLYFVYCIVFRDLAKVVYVGSTNNIYKRRRNYLEHAKQQGKETRVNVALTKFQPCSHYFTVNVLWSGECSQLEVLAIEQYYMDKFDTSFRGKNSDNYSSHYPLYLNTNRSCSNKILLLQAVKIVESDKQSMLFGAKAMHEHIETKEQDYLTELKQIQDQNQLAKEALELRKTGIAYAEVTNAFKRDQDIKNAECAAECANKKRRTEWKEQLELLDAKYKWATDQGKVQLALHIENLIKEMPLPSIPID